MNEKAQKLLNWLTDLTTRTSKRIVVGQHVRGSSLARRYPSHIETVHNETGKWFALLGTDFGKMDRYHDTSWPQAKPLLLNWWNAGGLITILWHMDNPITDGAAVDLRDLIDPASPVYTAWIKQLEEKADWLSELHDEEAVIIWRPFMECNGNQRNNWWKGAPYADLINAWRFMHNYFTNDRGLDNLIWLYGPQAKTDGRGVLEYYPGDSFVDLVGLSKYVGSSPMNKIANQGYTQLLTTGKPFVIAECGPGTGSQSPQPDTYNCQEMITDIRQYCPEARFLMFWDTTRSVSTHLNAMGLMLDPWAITREDLDWDITPQTILLTEVIARMQARAESLRIASVVLVTQANELNDRASRIEADIALLDNVLVEE